MGAKIPFREILVTGVKQSTKMASSGLPSLWRVLWLAPRYVLDWKPVPRVIGFKINK